MKLKKVINIFGGPGAGKSTLAYKLTGWMKENGYNVDFISEYAKQMVYENRMNVLEQDQLYVFAKQHRKILTLKDTVEYIVTDSPFIQGIVYLNKSVYNKSHFTDLILDTYNSYPNLNIYLDRSDRFKYDTSGRYQDEEGAKDLDFEIYYAMNNIGIIFNRLDAGDTGNEIRITDML